jgi:uncharacterized protein DUF3606
MHEACSLHRKTKAASPYIHDIERMPDDCKDRGHRNRDRIDVTQEQECRYWGDKLHVSVDRIREAVKQVGPLAKDVEHHLRNEAEVSRTA